MKKCQGKIAIAVIPLAMTLAIAVSSPASTGKVAFQNYTESDIYVVDSDGSNLLRLTSDSHPVDNGGPVISPDGRKVLFMSNRTGRYELYTVPSNGGDVVQLTFDSSYDQGNGSYDWSPDGSKILFSTKWGDDFNIYMMNADGSGIVTILDDAMDNGWPKFNKDGSKIYFNRSVPYNGFSGEVFVMNADGTGVQQLTNNPDGDGYTNASVRPQPFIGTDGVERLLFMRGVGYTTFHILVADIDGTNAVDITNGNYDDWCPRTYAGDPGVLVFFSNRAGDGTYTIWKMNADGTDAVRLSPLDGTKHFYPSYGASSNQPPVANAGAGRSAHVGVDETLDGSGSTDPDGDYPLSFAWSLVSQPAGSSAVLAGADTAFPRLRPDAVGDYRVTLVVTDQHGLSSSPADVVVTTTNSAPLANAGANMSVHRGGLVTLDGGGSTDPDGDYPLSFEWSLLSVPSNSEAILTNPNQVNPTFVADQEGAYIATLIVRDAWGLVSSTSSVTISTTNTQPLAAAGKDQVITLIGTQVHLDGTQSFDDDGDSITYGWAITTRPSGSVAALDDPSAARPSFIADVHGDYVVELKVSDPWTDSAPAHVTISFANRPPVADAGTNQAVVVGDRVVLDGTKSDDPNKDALSYRWDFVSKPAESVALIENSTDTSAVFTADAPGLFLVSLVVNDGFADSAAANVSVIVVTAQDAASQMLIEEAVPAINALPLAALKNANNKKALTNKINAALLAIDAGRYSDALSALQNDIVQRTDGCAKVGAPDRNDWVTTCEEQQTIYPILLDVIGYLSGLVP